jgi:hypothetical protein
MLIMLDMVNFYLYQQQKRGGMDFGMDGGFGVADL